MRAPVARALMVMATGCLGESRREWAVAMQAEFEAAAAEGRAMPFALGCLAAAGRQMLWREEGHFILTSYALALGLLLPMAAVQIGCALLGLPYLYADAGLPVVLLKGGAGDPVLKSVFLGGVPSFTLMLLVMGAGHLRLAWVILERDWTRALRVSIAMAAAAMTLVLVMSACFIDASRALLQSGVLAIELATVAMAARWHGQFSPAATEHPG